MVAWELMLVRRRRRRWRWKSGRVREGAGFPNSLTNKKRLSQVSTLSSPCVSLSNACTYTCTSTHMHTVYMTILFSFTSPIGAQGHLQVLHKVKTTSEHSCITILGFNSMNCYLFNHQDAQKHYIYCVPVPVSNLSEGLEVASCSRLSLMSCLKEHFNNLALHFQKRPIKVIVGHFGK